MDKKFTSVAQGFRQRTLVTAKLSAKLGVGVAKKLIKHKTQGVFSSSAVNLADDALNTDLSVIENRERLTKDAVDAALKLFEDMDQLKGLVMKFGQMASYMTPQMPPEAQRVMAKLQAEASALPFYEIKSLLVKELGRPLEEVFESFEAEAMAAASIGQVHKAMYKGRAVAVKIQYPGVKEAISSDLSIIDKFVPMTAMASSVMGMSVDSKAIFKELHDRIVEECDYKREAKNQQYALTCWPNDDKIIIPNVVEALCSDNVLVTEFMEGKGFYEFRDSASQEAKNRAAETLFRMSYESIFKFGFFNGDPHPGNYLFRDDGQVVFLDFGCVRYFEPEFLESWRSMVKAVLAGDKKGFKIFIREMGFVGNEAKFDWDYQWDLYGFILAPITSEEPFTYTKEYKEEGNRFFIYENKNKKSMNLPKPFVLVNRLQWGLKTILVDLQATGDFSTSFRNALFKEG